MHVPPCSPQSGVSIRVILRVSLEAKSFIRQNRGNADPTPSDGGNLYLVVDKKGGAKRWVFLFNLNNHQREAGLGSLHSVPLAKAREKAAEMRAALAHGRDPIIERRNHRPVRQKTFGMVTENFLATHQATLEASLPAITPCLKFGPLTSIRVAMISCAMLGAKRPGEAMAECPTTIARLNII
jgi:Arm DNA-binding domain